VRKSFTVGTETHTCLYITLYIYTYQNLYEMK